MGMKLIKVSEASRDALDWMVAKAEDMTFAPVSGAGSIWFKHGVWSKPGPGGEQHPYVLLNEYKHWADQCDGSPLRRGTGIWSPSTNPSQGHPIIEREHINTRSQPLCAWVANGFEHRDVHARPWFHQHGETALIAAMRCHVASKLGDEVEVPEELLK